LCAARFNRAREPAHVPVGRWSAEQLFPAFQSLGMTDVASNMEVTEYDADELHIR
jgi:hypothetical protein